jgi:hypothetical protein
VVNPVGVFGPVLGPDYSTSILLVKRLLDGSIPGCPDFWFGAVDVRDVAGLRLKAMTDPAARGEQFLATGGDFVSVLEVAEMLKDGARAAARKVPTRPLPKWLMRVVGLFDPEVKAVAPELGKHKNASNEKARRLLGWATRSPRDAILATTFSLSELGLLKAGLSWFTRSHFDKPIAARGGRLVCGEQRSAGAQEPHRIDGLAVDAHFVMEMWSGRAAGRAESADGFVRLHLLALFDQHFGKMAIAGR